MILTNMFPLFQLYKENDFDYLKIINVVKTSASYKYVEIAKLNGTSKYDGERIYSSTENGMIVRFQTNAIGQEKGFDIRIKHTVTNTICKDWLDIMNKTLSMPNQFDSENVSCSWIISEQRELHIMLELIYLEEIHGNLVIYDGGSNKNSSLVANHTANTSAKNISVSSNQMYVVFNAFNMSDQTRLFAKVHNAEKCQYWLDISNGWLTSPYHPKHYQNNLDCSWIISTEIDHVITLKFTIFQASVTPILPTNANLLIRLSPSNGYRTNF